VKRPFLWVGILALIVLAWFGLRSSGKSDSSDSTARAGDPAQVRVEGAGPSVVKPLPVATVSDRLPEERGGPQSEDLRRVIHSVRDALPKRAEFRPGDDEAAHHAGPELIRAGQALGDLAEYLERRPEEFRSASVFYANCAADEGLMPASRAVCYAALIRKKDQWAPGVDDRISRVGPEIVDIAKNLSE